MKRSGRRNTAKYAILTVAVAALAICTVWLLTASQEKAEPQKDAAAVKSGAPKTPSWIDGVADVKCLSGRENAFESALSKFIADGGPQTDVAYVYPYEDVRKDGRTRLYLAFGGEKWYCDVRTDAGEGQEFEFHELEWDVPNVQIGTGREDPEKPTPPIPETTPEAMGTDTPGTQMAPGGTPIADSAEMQDAIGVVGSYLLPEVLDDFCKEKGLSGERVALLGELTKNGNTAAFPIMVGDVRIHCEYTDGSNEFYLNVA